MRPDTRYQWPIEQTRYGSVSALSEFVPPAMSTYTEYPTEYCGAINSAANELRTPAWIVDREDSSSRQSRTPTAGTTAVTDIQMNQKNLCSRPLKSRTIKLKGSSPHAV